MLLLDDLKKTKDSRIINVSSLASEYNAEINWEDVNRTKNFNTMHAYAQSKLANVLFTEELNRYLSIPLLLPPPLISLFQEN